MNMKSQGFVPGHHMVVTPGWFSDTVAQSPVRHISFLRLDGDLFVSTWDAITGLYDRLVPGGIIYVDDYNSFRGCREAIDRFRTMHRIYEPIKFVWEHDWKFEAVWWVKRREHQLYYSHRGHSPRSN